VSPPDIATNEETGVLITPGTSNPGNIVLQTIRKNGIMVVVVSSSGL